MSDNFCNPQLIKDQLSRTEGQVIGIGKMVDETRDCAEILQQIVAARASLAKLGSMLLQTEAQGCFGKSNSSAKLKDLEKVVSQLFKIS